MHIFNFVLTIIWWNKTNMMPSLGIKWTIFIYNDENMVSLTNPDAGMPMDSISVVAESRWAYSPNDVIILYVFILRIRIEKYNGSHMDY